MGYSSTHHMLFEVPEEYANKLRNDPNRKEGHGQSYSIVDGKVMAEVNACWFTNLDIKKRHELMILWKDYNDNVFPKHDNYNAINVDKTSNIPKDYQGVIGVPITWLEKYNPEQFKILDLPSENGAPKVNGKNKFKRIFIQHI